jgi:hypothetical protein
MKKEEIGSNGSLVNDQVIVEITPNQDQNYSHQRDYYQGAEEVAILEPIIVNEPITNQLSNQNLQNESFRLVDEIEHLLMDLEQMTSQSEAGEPKNALQEYYRVLTQIRTNMSSDVEKKIFTESDKLLLEKNVFFLQSMLILLKGQQVRFQSLSAEDDTGESLSSFQKRLPESMQHMMEKRLEELHQQLQEEKTRLERMSHENLCRLEAQLKQKYQESLAKERQERRGRLDSLALCLKSLQAHITDLVDLHHLSRVLYRILLSLQTVEDALQDTQSTMFSLNQKHPIHHQLQTLRDVASTDPIFRMILQNIPQDIYDQGVLSEYQLRGKFHIMCDKVRRVQFVSETGGLWSHVVSFVFSYFAARPHLAHIDLRHDLSEEEAGDVELILARTEKFLNSGDFNGALLEMVHLQGWPRHIAHDWIHQARHYLELRQALDFIHARISLMVLSIA